MPEPISQKEIEKIEANGGKVNLLAKIIAIPGLEKIARHFHDMKHDQVKAYKESMTAKLAKFDQLIKVLEAKSIDLGPVVKIVSDIKAEHATLIAEFNAHKEHCDKDDEPCAYKLTGQRDRRGFIDLEHGLTFTPVEKE